MKCRNKEGGMIAIIVCFLMTAAIVGTYVWCLHREDSNCASMNKKAENH